MKQSQDEEKDRRSRAGEKGGPDPATPPGPGGDS
jgi:hypothetical protein